ncbi:unnamed protein product [Toxocara canis]|uniref:Ig-like domain-containing protein n=1 Tax=Toxocara canis TaxID=6265 RepID=A0A183U8E9_TOXCA|nr:unnamed protein product [Toxocara canis]
MKEWVGVLNATNETFSGDLITSILRIDHVTENDEGNYRCSATLNDSSIIHGEITLKIENDDLGAAVAAELSRATLSDVDCESENFTRPMYSWRKEGHTLCLRRSGRTRHYTHGALECSVGREIKPHIAEVTPSTLSGYHKLRLYTHETIEFSITLSAFVDALFLCMAICSFIVVSALLWLCFVLFSLPKYK